MNFLKVKNTNTFQYDPRETLDVNLKQGINNAIGRKLSLRNTLKDKISQRVKFKESNILSNKKKYPKIKQDYCHINSDQLKLNIPKSNSPKKVRYLLPKDTNNNIINKQNNNTDQRQTYTNLKKSASLKYNKFYNYKNLVNILKIQFNDSKHYYEKNKKNNQYQQKQTNLMETNLSDIDIESINDIKNEELEKDINQLKNIKGSQFNQEQQVCFHKCIANKITNTKSINSSPRQIYENTIIDLKYNFNQYETVKDNVLIKRIYNNKYNHTYNPKLIADYQFTPKQYIQSDKIGKKLKLPLNNEIEDIKLNKQNSESKIGINDIKKLNLNMLNNNKILKNKLPDHYFDDKILRKNKQFDSLKNFNPKKQQKSMEKNSNIYKFTKDKPNLDDYTPRELNTSREFSELILKKVLSENNLINQDNSKYFNQIRIQNKDKHEIKNIQSKVDTKIKELTTEQNLIEEDYINELEEIDNYNKKKQTNYNKNKWNNQLYLRNINKI